MCDYIIKEVVEKKDVRGFLELPVGLYKGKRNWIRPLDRDIEKVFDKDVNPLFANGECVRWILLDSNENIIGRVAAFVDYNTCNVSGIATGGMGFFECIDNYNAAKKLFDKCREWLEERKMEAMDGPVNFGPRHEWWGLLIEGDHEPNYSMPYTHRYYIDFFNRYGFKEYFKQFTYRTYLLEANLSKVIVWKSERLLRSGEYKIVSFKKRNTEKMMRDFVAIYNEAWVGDVPGVERISEEECRHMYAALNKVIDPRLIYFAYHNDRPIGFFIMVPEMNYLVKRVRGKVGLWNSLKLLYYKKVNPPKKALGLIFGVVPDFQGRGVEAALIKTFSDEAFKAGFPYQVLEMNWIGDFNPRMVHVMEYIGADIYKTHATYRKLFDESREFTRCPIIS